MTEFKTSHIEFAKKRKFIGMTHNKLPIVINITGGYMPFGVEEYQGKQILNIELPNSNNELYNIYSKLSSIEDFVKKQEFNADLDVTQALKGKGFVPSVKSSLDGHIVRTHIGDPDVYIMKKNGEKMIIDSMNLAKATADIKVILNGIWYTDNNYGLLWTTVDAKITKLS